MATVASVNKASSNHWLKFIITRALTIKWLHDELDVKDAEIAKIMSMSELEVKLIRTTPIDE